MKNILFKNIYFMNLINCFFLICVNGFLHNIPNFWCQILLYVECFLLLLNIIVFFYKIPMYNEYLYKKILPLLSFYNKNIFQSNNNLKASKQITINHKDDNLNKFNSGLLFNYQSEKEYLEEKK